MIRVYFIFIFFLLVSCHIDKKTHNNVVDSKTKSIENDVNRKQNDTNEIYPLLFDTLNIGSEKFFVVQNNPRDNRKMNFSILNIINDTIYIHNGFGSNGFEIEDFDNNGILDIKLLQISNVGRVSELIFYDKKNKNFKAIKDFDNFYEPTKLKKTKYWFSYHRSGCADLNWGSELFMIEKFKAIKVGEIEGIGCEDERENGIFIYKVKGNSRKKIYSKKREPGYYDDKWTFIERYWNKNYNKFQ